MDKHFVVSLALVGISVVTGACRSAAAPDATVTIGPEVRHQEILGWGKTTPWFSASAMLRDQCSESAVNDLGLNRLRFEGLCGNRAGSRGRSWEWLNDNDNPFDINWDGFNTEATDERINGWLVPWNAAVEARGEPFNIYVSPSFFRGGSSGDVPPWLLADPEDYPPFFRAPAFETKGFTAAERLEALRYAQKEMVRKEIRARPHSIRNFRLSHLPTYMKTAYKYALGKRSKMQ